MGVDLAGATWRKSTYSNGSGGNCVEVADLPSGRAKGAGYGKTIRAVQEDI